MLVAAKNGREARAFVSAPTIPRDGQPHMKREWYIHGSRPPRVKHQRDTLMIHKAARHHSGVVESSQRTEVEQGASGNLQDLERPVDVEYKKTTASPVGGIPRGKIHLIDT